MMGRRIRSDLSAEYAVNKYMLTQPSDQAALAAQATVQVSL